MAREAVTDVTGWMCVYEQAAGRLRWLGKEARKRDGHEPSLGDHNDRAAR